MNKILAALIATLFAAGAYAQAKKEEKPAAPAAAASPAKAEKKEEKKAEKKDEKKAGATEAKKKAPTPVNSGCSLVRWFSFYQPCSLLQKHRYRFTIKFLAPALHNPRM